MKEFKKFMIWQLGIDIVDNVYELVDALPTQEKFGLQSQLTRSAVSIPANIAEGSSKRSERDYVRFLEMAFGSAFELETHALIVKRRRWTTDMIIEELLELVRREQQMLSKFIDKLNKQ